MVPHFLPVRGLKPLSWTLRLPQCNHNRTSLLNTKERGAAFSINLCFIPANGEFPPVATSTTRLPFRPSISTTPPTIGPEKDYCKCLNKRTHTHTVFEYVFSLSFQHSPPLHMILSFSHSHTHTHILACINDTQLFHTCWACNKVSVPPAGLHRAHSQPSAAGISFGIKWSRTGSFEV